VRFIEALEGALVVSSARVYKRARRLSSPAGAMHSVERHCRV